MAEGGVGNVGHCLLLACPGGLPAPWTGPAEEEEEEEEEVTSSLMGQ